MKKILTAFIVFLMAITLAAETGYRGVEWGMTKLLVSQRRPAFSYDEFPEDIMVEIGKILNEFNDIFYCFVENRLASISYVISADKENELLEKFDKTKQYKLVAKLESFYEPEPLPERTEAQERADIITVIEAYTQTNYYGGFFDRGRFETENPSNFRSIYFDYNDDTYVQVIIDEPINKLLVIYHAAPQDF